MVTITTPLDRINQNKNHSLLLQMHGQIYLQSMFWTKPDGLKTLYPSSLTLQSFERDSYL